MQIDVPTKVDSRFPRYNPYHRHFRQAREATLERNGCSLQGKVGGLRNAYMSELREP